ncbi:26S proteasome complex subunit SEM1 isoform X1 [Cebus imitator]|uniref:26S proteasome complex subunit SEM1 isoform X1 n=1 Tax=Cebus imitator TaxID=2715852 RepID=UPI00080A4A33|nr:26S proteasome complex subunit SEM1 isoform X1 [Cebus imitator]
MSEKKQPVDLGLLEEDDEFEEFPAEDWAGLDEDEDAHVWEDNWDDDNVEDDFSNQLRATILLMIQVYETPYSRYVLYQKGRMCSAFLAANRSSTCMCLWPHLTANSWDAQ